MEMRELQLSRRLLQKYQGTDFADKTGDTKKNIGYEFIAKELKSSP